MALPVYWYDFVCFGIVGAAFIGSLWVLWRKEIASRNDSNTIYESLLVSRPDTDGFVDAMPPNHVGSSQLWTTCWKGLHPACLLATRIISFLVLGGFLMWDLADWDASTLVMYYTDFNWVVLTFQSKMDGEGHWILWQVPVCGFIIIATAVSSFYTIKNAKSCPLFFDDFWKPCWKFLNPLWLLFFRVSAFICLAPFQYEIVAIDGAFAFYFYTQWTYALVMLYFALASVTSAYGIWFAPNKMPRENGQNGGLFRGDVEDFRITNSTTYREKDMQGNIKVQSQYAQEAIKLRAGIWGYLMQTVYQTSAGAVILTDIVFWCLIVPFGSNAHLGLNVLMGCLHSLNAVFLLLDTALNNLPFPWFRLAYFVQWSCLYVVFQWVVHACGMTWWPYPFLELDIPWAPFWYFALAVVHIPCYGIYALIVKAKYSFFSRWFPSAFVRSY